MHMVHVTHGLQMLHSPAAVPPQQQQQQQQCCCQQTSHHQQRQQPPLLLPHPEILLLLLPICDDQHHRPSDGTPGGLDLPTGDAEAVVVYFRENSKCREYD